MKGRKASRPRIGVPWRTFAEEVQARRGALEMYLHSVERSGGRPVEISLGLSPAELARVAESLDGFVLPGSPADIEPRRFGGMPHAEEAAPDKRRERTDDTLVDHALNTGKPLLAICYGAQLLNVHLHGTLVQDIPSELGSAADHDGGRTRNESLHLIHIHSRCLAELAGSTTARVNSSHHQSVRTLGRGLRVAARAPDGVIEAVEWTGGPGWVLGVQWHPERMPGDRFADAVFGRLFEEAQKRARTNLRRKRAAPVARRTRRKTKR